MKKYISFFRLRFTMGLQYRVAAWAGVFTQFFWGAMLILSFKAFYESDPTVFPMSFQATCSYFWLQQALLGLISVGSMDGEFFQVISSGDVAYELCRPVDVYGMWFSRSAASRLANALLRCVPALAVASFIPAPYGLMAPPSLGTFLCFLLSLTLALGVVTALCMIVYMITFHTISPRGVRLMAVGISDFLAGAIIPLPFFPEKLRWFLELLPFSAMENVPLRIYTGDLAGQEMVRLMLLQLFWIGALVLIGKLLEQKELKNVIVQGG